MDSPQSVVSPFKNSVVVVGEAENQKTNHLVESFDGLSKGETKTVEQMDRNLDNFIGVLEVYVHQAKDIHNICIYHKQDVYAKLCLTNDPETSVSTKIINGGGRNPVFNDNVRLDVRTVDTSLKCEIFMMSRVKNYLEDQLLGFALVPLSEVVLKNGKLGEKEFALSSTDLFHSPAGFVQLSLSYSGASPDVMTIPSMPIDKPIEHSEEIELLSDNNMDKIEFPDPKIANENQIMVSEYFEMSCSNMESESSESLVTCDAQVHHVEEINPVLASSPSNVSSNVVSSSPDAQSASKTPNEEQTSEAVVVVDNNDDAGNGETDSSGGVPRDETMEKPVLTVNIIEPEQPKMVQQDIVDMYMKSMQQFTESLAKMKLPLDIDNSPTNSENSSSDQKLQGSKNNNGGTRVFYGSSAFY